MTHKVFCSQHCGCQTTVNISSKKIPAKHVLLLHGTQLHSDNQLGLGGHVLEDVGLQSPQHVRPQKVMELLNLVLFGDVRKLFQEAFEVTEQTLKTKSVNITCQCSEDKRTAGRVSSAEYPVGVCRSLT